MRSDEAISTTGCLAGLEVGRVPAALHFAKCNAAGTGRALD